MTTDWDVWFGWLEAAAACNEYADPVPNPGGRIGGSPAGDDAPGSDFNRHGSWDETGLFEAGWRWCRKTAEDAGFLTRPGKERGVSASAGTATSQKNGWPLFYCFSTSTEFSPDTAYTRFGVFAKLRHGGDMSAAAKDLAARGYGRRQPDPAVVFGPAAPAARPDAAGRLFKWMSELEARADNDKWLWKGYLSRGGLTVLSALWKAGKSTLLSHLLRACDGRASEFLGREIVPFRVLYVSEEHEEMWAERRDELGIRDHVGMISRPFKGRASPADWARFIAAVAAAVVEHQFDLVVIDTISKMWPVREENDAGQVEEALIPLWTVTNTGAAVLLVHHNRKSGGKNFTGMRGSGGLPAFAETLIEFDRHGEGYKDRKRVLNCEGRYRESQGKILIELRPEGYVLVNDDFEEAAEFGAPAMAGQPGVTPEERIVQVLARPERVWFQIDDIRDGLRAGATGMRFEDVSRHLSELYFRRQVVMWGKLRSKTQPRQYALASRSSTFPPMGFVGTWSGNETIGPVSGDVVPDSGSDESHGAERQERDEMGPDAA